MTPTVRTFGFLALASALALGLGACGRKGPLEPPPYAALPPAPEPGAVVVGVGPPPPALPVAAPAAPAAAVATGTAPGVLREAPFFAPADNPTWYPQADRTAGVNGATTREVATAPAAKERSVLDWLVD